MRRLDGTYAAAVDEEIVEVNMVGGEVGELEELVVGLRTGVETCAVHKRVLRCDKLQVFNPAVRCGPLEPNDLAFVPTRVCCEISKPVVQKAFAICSNLRVNISPGTVSLPKQCESSPTFTTKRRRETKKFSESQQTEQTHVVNAVRLGDVVCTGVHCNLTDVFVEADASNSEARRRNGCFVPACNMVDVQLDVQRQLRRGNEGTSSGDSGGVCECEREIEKEIIKK